MQKKKGTWFLVMALVGAAILAYLYSQSQVNLNAALPQLPGSFTVASPQVQCVNNKPQVTLSWGVSLNTLSYQVERKVSTQFAWAAVSPILPQTTRTFADTTVTAPNTYNYRVTAINGVLKKSSNSVTISVATCAAPPSSSSSKASSSVSSSSVSSSSSAVSSSSSLSSLSSLSSSRSSIASSSSPSPVSRLWGAYVGESLSASADFESQVGKKMNMQSLFVGSTDSFPSGYGPSVRDKGKTLIIFWEPSESLDAIIAGNSDAAIQQFASGARSYAGPVIFAPFHEMNGDWDSWGGTVGTNTPAKLVEAWQHVHDLFAGVTNVKFGWVVNNDSVPDTPENSIVSYYPGSAYVDYVGVDGFNFGNPWQTFSQVFNSSLAQIKGYGKPVYIFSMASAQGTLKAAWITDALVTQMKNHPEVKGWVWFNQNKEKDWRVWSDAASLQAFKNALP